jgi:phosphoglycerate dehydrogenase-like enzyme
MIGRVHVLIATPLQQELVERIVAVDPALHVVHRPDLIGHARFAADHTPPVLRTKEQDEEWAELLREAEILFDVDQPSACNLPVRAQHLRWIQATSSGVGQWIHRLGLADTDIVVTNAAGVHAVPLAEFVVMAALFFAKRMPKVLRDQREHHWELFSVPTLRDKTVCIVSLGRVGREVARYCRFMGMRVIGSRRAVGPTDQQELGVDRVFAMDELPEALAECDYLVLSVPLSEETRGLIGSAQLAALRPTATLINIARGQVVDEAALLLALQSHRLAGAALDVTSVEPLPPDSPFWGMDNVLLTEHSMSAAEEENQAIVELFCDNLRRYLSGSPLRNVVDKKRGYSPISLDSEKKHG